MNEINNFKYLFFKRLYDELGLAKIEKGLATKGIKCLNILKSPDYDIISHYFFLLNEVNLNKLNEEQLDKFHYYFKKNIKTLTDDELQEIYIFIDETYPLILFPNRKTNYVYYGPINNNYWCPKDAIAIGLYYDIFQSKKESLFELQNELTYIINNIQFKLAKNIGKKIAVIRYNQITLNYRNQNSRNYFD